MSNDISDVHHHRLHLINLLSCSRFPIPSAHISPDLGELMKDDQVKHKHYKNIYKSVQSIVKAEGIRGLQKGLSGQLGFQFIYQSARLGTYQTIDDLGFLSLDENGKLSTFRSVLAGGVSGWIGVTLACPFYMIKTQLQAQTSNAKYAAGYQHQHKGLVDAFKTTYGSHGLKVEFDHIKTQQQ